MIVAVIGLCLCFFGVGNSKSHHMKQRKSYKATKWSVAQMSINNIFSYGDIFDDCNHSFCSYFFIASKSLQKDLSNSFSETLKESRKSCLKS